MFYRAGVKAYPDDPRKAAELAVAANDAARGLDHLRRASYQPVGGLPEPPAGFGGPPAPPDGPKGKEPPKEDGPKGKGPKDGPKGKAPPPPPLKDEPKGKEPPAIPAAGPPTGAEPWASALDALTRARDRITAAGEAPAGGAARDFLDAARATYARGRTAYETGEYRTAGELARAAEAWSHVPEHLARAGWDGPDGPPVAPEPKKKGLVPPPPLPIKD